MSYQINLCPSRDPISQVPWPAKRLACVFGAVTCGVALITAGWVWQLRSNESMARAQLQSKQQAISSLQKQLGLDASAVALSGPALSQELLARRSHLARIQARLTQLQRGVMAQGSGHAARLSWVASTIPPSAWLTQLKLDEERLELSGATLEPAMLNSWMDALTASPLFKNQSLNALKVERMTASAREAAGRAGRAQVWQFTLSAAGGV